MHLRKISATLVAATAALTLAACGGDGGSDPGDSPAAETSGGGATDEGTVLDQPFAKPDLVLTDTEGQPYDFAAETEGHATLLYFGYTNCPDICPLTMSNIALAADSLDEEQRADLRVVFVTTDPERDTPESLGPWLDAQSPDFTGLTGDFTTIQEAARSLGVHIEPSYEDDDGGIVSTHGTQVVAFLPTDDQAHVIYTEGVTAETFERDLPGLIAGELP
ncbi:SCO family protein [Streptomyces radicis]|uniref:SCO family protein n=1 Tax=Streptomyces radicis TaxID=1750517 RepID=A0A3A9WCZ0_9ACTN|nr:SCO family protein [Streptomyces radicis]RKN07234.1 SCO family protein [Streptomyces radicis]RKN26748.1 SCO family protein [Streptomyces radicis]